MTARPPLFTYAILALNVLMFVICVAAAGGQPFTNRLLYGYGAIVNSTLADGAYWRLLAAAFLHGSFQHIFSNMICLLFWAPVLETTLGPVRFLTLYMLSAIGGSATSIVLHNHANLPYLSIGASGALSGLVGALLALTLIGRLRLTAQFFISTIALNGVIMATNSQIDWQDHLGGFLTGLVLALLLSTTLPTPEPRQNFGTGT